MELSISITPEELELLPYILSIYGVPTQASQTAMVNEVAEAIKKDILNQAKQLAIERKANEAKNEEKARLDAIVPGGVHNEISL